MKIAPYVHIQQVHLAQNTALFLIFRKLTFYILFCTFRLDVKNDSVKSKQTRAKSGLFFFFFFGSDQKNQEVQV